MLKFIARRLVWMLVTLIALSAITFFLMHAIPGGPWDKEKRLPEEIIRNLNQYYHLDWPLWRQYTQYVYDVMVPRVTTQAASPSPLDQFLFDVKLGSDYSLRWMNFGPSYVSRSRTVNDILRENLPVSIQLGLMTTIFVFVLAVPLGVLTALKRNTVWDYAGMALMIVGRAVPSLSLAVILALVFGLWLRVLPISGWGARPPFVLGFLPREFSPSYLAYAILPVFVLGFPAIGYLGRMVRASVLDVLHEDYIRTARGKGLPTEIILIRHVLKNSLLPAVTIAGPAIAGVLTGSLVVEGVFNIPGMGRYFLNCIYQRDYPVIMGTTLLYAMFLIVANAAVDIIYTFLDPRIRLA